jgi:hypothetical protein
MVLGRNFDCDSKDNFDFETKLHRNHDSLEQSVVFLQNDVGKLISKCNDSSDSNVDSLTLSLHFS